MARVLDTAVKYQKWETLKNFIEKYKVDFNTHVSPEHRCSLISLAAEYGRFSIIRRLIERRAETTPWVPVNWTAGNYPPVLAACKSPGGSCSEKQYKRKLEALEMLLDYGFDPKQVDHWGNSALFWLIHGHEKNAGWETRAEMIKLLQNHGVDLNQSCALDGTKSLALAKWNGMQPKLAEFLKKNGATEEK